MVPALMSYIVFEDDFVAAATTTAPPAHLRDPLVFCCVSRELREA